MAPIGDREPTPEGRLRIERDRWAERVTLVENRAKVARMVLEGRLDDLVRAAAKRGEL